MNLIHIIPSGEWGAPERYAFDICSHFRDKGWSVQVLTRDARAVDSHFRQKGLDIRHAPLRRYPDAHTVSRLAGMMRAIPRGEKGVVHLHRSADIPACRMARFLARRPDIRIILTCHGAPGKCRGLMRGLLYGALDTALFVSEFSRRTFFERWAPGKAPLKEENTAITYYSPGGDTTELLPEPGKGSLTGAYMGRLEPGNGLETVIDALSLLKEHKVRVKIIGRGHPDYIDRLRQRAQMAGVNDRIDWIRSSEFKPSQIATVHFGVLPGESPEAGGLANLEFMACGRPQISTFVGDVREILNAGDDSLSVPPSDPQALSEAIIRLSADADFRRSLGENARKRYDELFSWQKFINRIENIYCKP